MVPPRIENAAKNAVKFNMDRVSEKKEIEKKKSV